MNNLYAKASEIAQLEVFEEYPGVRFLHVSDDKEGTVAMVYEVKGKRYYHAEEFTIEDGNLSATGGYKTTERFEMGDRYRGLWGKFEKEVY